MDLRKIDFGKSAAELDEQLREYFVATAAYDDVISGSRGILLGRKGAGKTAIMRYSLENDGKAGRYALKVEATHATYIRISERLQPIASSIHNLDSSFKLGWLITTAVCMINRAMDECGHLVTGDEHTLYKFAREKLGYDPADPISAIAGYVFDWYRNLTKAGPVERALPERGESMAIGSMAFDENRLLRIIETASKRFTIKGYSIHIFYDKIDERWDGSDLYIAFIQGLLLATRDIKAIGKNIYPVVLLRDDIFRIIGRNFQHLDHYRTEIAYIRWDESTLIELVGMRIRHSLSKVGEKTKETDNQKLWAACFPQQFKDRKHTISSSAYVAERTLLRPRDIIHFCTLLRDAAKNLRVESLSLDQFKECEKTYSKEKRHDLVAEYSYKYPGLEALLDKFKRQTNGFQRSELEFLIAQFQEQLPANNEFAAMDVHALIRLLYEIGFFCYTSKGGILRGTRVIHSGVSDDSDNFMQESRIFVSPIFRKGLDLKDH